MPATDPLVFFARISNLKNCIVRFLSLDIFPVEPMGSACSVALSALMQCKIQKFTLKDRFIFIMAKRITKSKIVSLGKLPRFTNWQCVDELHRNNRLRCDAPFNCSNAYDQLLTGI